MPPNNTTRFRAVSRTIAVPIRAEGRGNAAFCVHVACDAAQTHVSDSSLRFVPKRNPPAGFEVEIIASPSRRFAGCVSGV